MLNKKKRELGKVEETVEKKKKEEEESEEEEKEQEGGKGSNTEKSKKTIAKKDYGSKKNVASSTERTLKKGRSVRTRRERYFKLIDVETGKSYGRYTGDTPKQAASKSYTKLLQKLREEGKALPKQSTIYLRESTRGGAKKIYGYVATRQRLREPQNLEIIDKESGNKKTITYHFRNIIKKVPVPEQIGGLFASKSRKSQNRTSKKVGKTKGDGTSKKGSKTKKNTKYAQTD
ncbi:MAG: non-histone chromosomal MC1 family protein [Nitrososphaerota archaeon]